MALTRKFFKAMGIEDEKIDQIIEAHTETVDTLKAYKEDAEKLPTVQKELDDLKAKGDDGWKEKHDTVKKQFDDYKAEIAAKDSRDAKEKAVRAYYESKAITGKSLDIAMRGSAEEIAALELDGDKIKDTKALDALVEGTFAGLVSKTTTTGANTSNPPENTGGTMTKDEIYKIKDPIARQNAIAANLNLFRKEN